MKDFVSEMKWREMIHDSTPGIEDVLKNETSGYIGFDPTADSLHIGNLVQIMILVHFQRSGHKPFALIGGATGMVGDPAGKSEERNLLDEEELKHNETCIRVQLEKFLDFDSGSNSAVMVNNYDWFKERGFLEFLRDVGKHLTINYMMSKDSVKSRLETGISYTEFSYQILQGYDYLYLYENYGVKLQMGGSDQWGNITTGTELIRRKLKGEVYAMTTPLITKSDGSKFGKTEEGNIWLDEKQTSPYKFYQFWLNCSDEDSSKLIRIFSLKTKEEIESIEKLHLTEPHARHLQKAMAEEITCRVHSNDALQSAINASKILFGNSTTDELGSIDEATLLNVFDGVPQNEITHEKYQNIQNVTDLLSIETDGFIFNSKGEARRMIQGGGVSINKIKVSDSEQKPDFNLLQDKYLLIQKGKKNYFLLKLV